MTKTQRVYRALRECLLVRAGQELTPEIIEDRARNGAHYVLEALESETPTPTGYDVNESPEAMAERLIK